VGLLPQQAEQPPLDVELVDHRLLLEELDLKLSIQNQFKMSLIYLCLFLTLEVVNKGNVPLWKTHIKKVVF
jgi:hypothetical protein